MKFKKRKNYRKKRSKLQEAEPAPCSPTCSGRHPCGPDGDGAETGAGTSLGITDAGSRAPPAGILQAEPSCLRTCMLHTALGHSGNPCLVERGVGVSGRSPVAGGRGQSCGQAVTEFSLPQLL